MYIARALTQEISGLFFAKMVDILTKNRGKH